MNLRLTDTESDALRAGAEQEGRSMQEVARTAVAQYVSDRPQRVQSAVERVRTEDREGDPEDLMLNPSSGQVDVPGIAAGLAAHLGATSWPAPVNRPTPRQRRCGRHAR
jgi:hypothetical protein